MKKISSLMKGSKCPLMIYLNQKETASASSITTNVFRDKANGFPLVTNITAPKSIVGGEAPVKVVGVSQDIDVASLLSDETIQHMVDSENNHVYMDVELAFDLNGEKFISPLTGNEVTLKYAESADEADDADESEDDSSEDTSEDESDSEDNSEDDSDDSADEADEVETVSSAEDIPAETDESEEESTDDMSMEDDSTSEDDSSSDDEEEMANPEENAEDDSEKPEGMSDSSEDEDAGDIGSEEIEVSMLDMADPSKAIRLVSLTNDYSEIAAFIGDTPVGSLRQDRASESASFLYQDPKKLFGTFKDRFKHVAKTGKFDELASLGFEPYVAKATVSEYVNKFIEQETAAVREEIASERSTGIDRHKKVVNLAMVGIFKGLYDKATNPLVKEISSLLRQAGHQSPEASVRRALVASAPEFAKVLFARADELAKEDDAYLNGITDTVASADFKSSESEETANLGRVTTLFGATREAASEEGFVSQSDKKPTVRRFDKLVAGLGRRR